MSTLGALQPGGLRMTILTWILLGVMGVICADHSLRGYEMAVSSPGPGLPLYYVILYVDDKVIGIYTSDSRQYLPKVEWIKNLEAEYWQRETQRTQMNEIFCKSELQQLMDIFNHTGGDHFCQWIYSCALSDDGSTETYLKHGYDGQDLMYLDTRRGLYIPVMSEAQIFTKPWNTLEEGDAEFDKNYLEIDCVEYLKKFIIYGKTDLENKVRPEVKVWGRQQDGVTKLYCLAYGFYPRGVDVTWMRNGTDHIVSLEDNPILPHPDGTYQTRVIVEVPTGSGDSYSCHVDHSSLEEPLVFIWDSSPKAKDPSVLIAVVVSLGVLLSIAAAGFILYRRRSGLTGTPLSGDPGGGFQALQSPD